MNRKIIWVFSLILLLALLAFPATARAADLLDDEIIAGGNYTLESGELQDGSLVIFGGNADLKEGSTVDGDVLVFGGNLIADGVIHGSIFSLGGSTSLGESAVVSGDLVNVGGSVARAPGAQVGGDVITPDRIPSRLELPRLPRLLPFFNPDNDFVQPQVDFGINRIFNTVMGGFWFLFRVFITAALAVLVVLIFPRPMERSSRAVAKQPVMSYVVGLLTLLVLPIILVVMIFTILLIPVTLVGFLALAVLLFFGWVALGYFLGLKLMGMLKQNWAPAVAAGLGTFSLSLVAWGFSALVPCVGWLLPWTLACLGLGAVLITRIGTQDVSGAEPPTPTSDYRPVFPEEPPYSGTLGEGDEPQI